jgi:hypothetical protein
MLTSMRAKWHTNWTNQKGIVLYPESEDFDKSCALAYNTIVNRLSASAWTHNNQLAHFIYAMGCIIGTHRVAQIAWDCTTITSRHMCKEDINVWDESCCWQWLCQRQGESHMTLVRIHSWMYWLDDHVFSGFECYHGRSRDHSHIAHYIYTTLMCLGPGCKLDHCQTVWHHSWLLLIACNLSHHCWITFRGCGW